MCLSHQPPKGPQGRSLRGPRRRAGRKALCLGRMTDWKGVAVDPWQVSSEFPFDWLDVQGDKWSHEFATQKGMDSRPATWLVRAFQGTRKLLSGPHTTANWLVVRLSFTVNGVGGTVRTFVLPLDLPPCIAVVSPREDQFTRPEAGWVSFGFPGLVFERPRLSDVPRLLRSRT